MKKIAIKMILLYQKFVSPCLIKTCRYVPSCSEYAKQAIEEKGLIKGGLKAVGRLLRCNPFCAGGYDPVDKSCEAIKQ